MTTVNPTQPLRALRNHTQRSCHDLGVCLHPDRACPGVCIQAAAMQRLAPGVVDGPYTSHPARRERLSRTIMLVACALAVVVVLAEIARVLA